MWVPPAPSAFIASCGKLRELDDIDTALMDVDVQRLQTPSGPRFSLRALASCSLGSRNRLVAFSQCRHPPLPRSRASAPAEHFLQPGCLRGKSGPSRVSILWAKRWHLRWRVCSGPATNSALLLSSRSQPQEQLPFGDTMPRCGQSPLRRRRSSPLDGAAQEICPRLDKRTATLCRICRCCLCSLWNDTVSWQTRRWIN